MSSDDLLVRHVERKGRGVFARRRFLRGEIIEQAPVLILGADEYELLNHTTLRDYYYAWGENACAIPMGLSMLYNYSSDPNAAAVRDIDAGTITFVALRDIELDEEISHRYLCEPWFEVIS